MERNKRVLVTPLDWGLGHATRCVPLVRELLNQNCEVIIASNGDALTLMHREFPLLQTFELPGYNPVYPANGSMVRKMALQLPKFIKTIAAEHLEVEKIVRNHNVDVVISDNRYGCFSKKVKSIFITHQLHILMPDGYQWIEGRVNHFNAEQIKQYAECWVPMPDVKKSFVPKLMDADKTISLRAIGYLSRFEKMTVAKKYDVLVICSGPEPQRTLFEELLSKKLSISNLNYLIVKGKPVKQEKPAASVVIANAVDFMNAEELNIAIEASDLIIARSGYSTVMDLARLEKKAIFIPTPGQTEQEYIAEALKAGKIAYYMPQQKFDWDIALKESAKFKGFTNFEQDNSLLKNAIASIC